MNIIDINTVTQTVEYANQWETARAIRIISKQDWSDYEITCEVEKPTGSMTKHSCDFDPETQIISFILRQICTQKVARLKATFLFESKTDGGILRYPFDIVILKNPADNQKLYDQFSIDIDEMKETLKKMDSAVTSFIDTQGKRIDDFERNMTEKINGMTESVTSMQREVQRLSNKIRHGTTPPDPNVGEVGDIYIQHD